MSTDDQSIHSNSLNYSKIKPTIENKSIENDKATFKWSNFKLKALFRTNSSALNANYETGLNRCLSWYDLIAYGCANTIGAGIYRGFFQLLNEFNEFNNQNRIICCNRTSSK